MKANPRPGRCQLCHLLIKKKLAVVIPPFMLSTNEKKPLSTSSDAPKITELFSQDFVERTTTTNLYGAIWQCVFENHCGKVPYSIVC